MTAGPDEGKAASATRVRLLVAYMRGERDAPILQDPRGVYRIATEERSYQQRRIVALSRELAGLAPDDPRRAELEAGLADARKMQATVFELLKKIAGVRGKTGGSGFLPPPEQPPAEERGSKAAIDDAFGFLGGEDA